MSKDKQRTTDNTSCTSQGGQLPTVAGVALTEQAALELREQEQKYRSLFANTLNGIALHKVVVDDNGKVIDYVFEEVNQAFERLTTLKGEDIIGRRVTEVIPGIEHDSADWIGRYGRVALEGDVERFEQYSKSLDKWFSVLAYCHKKGHFVTVFGEITERKRARQELVDLKLFYQTVLESVHDGIWVTDEHDRLIFFNKGMEEIAGVRSAEVLGLSVTKDFPSETTRSFLPFYHRARESQSPTPYEAEIITPDGRRTVQAGWIVPRFMDQRYAGMICTIRDITKEHQARREVQTIFDMSLDLICIADINTATFLRINPSFTRLLGYDEAELLSRPFLDYVHPDDVEPTLRVIKEGLQKGQAVTTFENRYRCADGSYRWLDWTSHPDPSRGITFAIAHDITQRKQTEQAIVKERDRAQSYLNIAGVMIVALDQRGRITLVNQKACQVLGYAESELQGRDWIDTCVPPTVREQVRHVFGRIMAGEIDFVEYFENVIVTKSGQERTVWWHNACVYDEQGQIMGALSSGEDITERKRTEQALKESEERYRSLVESATIGIALISPDMRVLSLNHRMKQWFPHAVELGAMPCYAQFNDPPFGEVCPWCPVKEALADGQVHESITSTPTADGVVHFRVIASPVRDEAGNISSVIETVEDVTARMRLEKELQNQAKLESIGVLAGGIAHDFNNILTAVVGNISLASLDLPADSAAARALQNATDAAARATGLTHQLLTFSKGGEPVKKVTALNAIIEEAARFSLHGSNVTCEFALAEDLCSAEVDPGQITQVINNLVINADQAMPSGGRIRISAGNVHLPEADPAVPLAAGRFVRIAVTDEGIGIPEELLPKVFDPFFTTKQRGSGLGLASCYSIVRNHGGYIAVTSEQGAGTQFVVYLPATDERPVRSERRTSIVPRGHGRVLIMDDEQAICDVATRSLAKFGYDVHAVGDGRRAVASYEEALLASRPFDLVILDLTIPGGEGGLDVLRKLQAIDPEVLAIVSSGYSNDPIMANHLEHGFQACVAKPFKPMDLGLVVQALLDQRITRRDPRPRVEDDQ